ncbi:hypothetical protein Tco_0007398 [Tanacetum coccineum]
MSSGVAQITVLPTSNAYEVSYKITKILVKGTLLIKLTALSLSYGFPSISKAGRFPNIFRSSASHVLEVDNVQNCLLKSSGSCPGQGFYKIVKRNPSLKKILSDLAIPVIEIWAEDPESVFSFEEVLIAELKV